MHSILLSSFVIYFFCICHSGSIPIVFQITLETNLAVYGPYGSERGYPFSVDFYNKRLAFIGVRTSYESLVGMKLYFYCK